MAEYDHIIILKTGEKDVLSRFKVYYRIWKFRPGTQ